MTKPKKVKNKLGNNFPKIYRASDGVPPPKFPFDDKVEDDWSDFEICPSCNIRFSEHSPRKIVRCALAELRGGKEK